MTARPETLSQLRAFVLSQWMGNDAAMAADAILARAEEAVEKGRLSYGEIAAMTGRKEVDAAVMAAVTILVSTRASVFDVVFLFRDGDEKEPSLLLPRATVSTAMEQGWLEHPVTGERVEEWDRRAYPCVEPNDYLRGLVAREMAPAPTP